MENKQIEAIINATFPGLMFFCRDLDLDEQLIAKYKPDQILMERGFTDMSQKLGGLAKNCRYLIASANAKNAGLFNPDAAEFGHAMLQSNSFFKVLDIQKQNGKTQILLLHIPEEGVELFVRSKISVEEEIIEKGIASFQDNVGADPVAELQAPDWLKRTSPPIGMNDEGVFFMDMDSNNETSGKSSDSESRPASTSEKSSSKKGFWSRLLGRK